jgi:hypothetical protein
LIHFGTFESKLIGRHFFRRSELGDVSRFPRRLEAQTSTRRGSSSPKANSRRQDELSESPAEIDDLKRQLSQTFEDRAARNPWTCPAGWVLADILQNINRAKQGCRCSRET